jgi:hypothetical protein
MKDRENIFMGGYAWDHTTQHIDISSNQHKDKSFGSTLNMKNMCQCQLGGSQEDLRNKQEKMHIKNLQIPPK